jgi:hypothetical protein
VGIPIRASWEPKWVCRIRAVADARRWPSVILGLAANPPTEHRGRQVFDRRAWIVEGDNVPVGLVDVEVYGDQTASLAFVIAPDRRCRGAAGVRSSRLRS